MSAHAPLARMPRAAPQAAQDAPAFHAPQYQVNRLTGLWRGSCACGWCWTGTREDVLTRSATHDLDAVETPSFWTAAQ